MNSSVDVLGEIVIPTDAAQYFPPLNGRYEVKPGLLPLGRDWGNGHKDGQLFQFDSGFSAYRRAKLISRTERLGKYYQTCDCDPDLSGAVADFIARRLIEEHPQQFALERENSQTLLRCGPSGEQLCFDSDMQNIRGKMGMPPYVDPLDALAMQVQEDLAVVRRADGRDWLCAIHLCSANHWAAEAKIGRPFAQVHAPVPGMARFKPAALVRAMIEKGPFVRFAWGLSTDRRLNHHPQAPSGIDATIWRGRRFDAEKPRLFLRVERQVLWGLPQMDAALFAIRTYFRDCEKIRRNPELCTSLCAAVESMTAEELEYKGLAESREDILTWLEAGFGD